MDKDLKIVFMRKIAFRAGCLILLAVLLSVACIMLKQHTLRAEMEALNDTYMNKYNIDLVALDFLNKQEKEKYKKQFIQACEAYDLVKVTKIAIDKGSIVYDRETNMYEWSSYCNDEKKTSFLSAWKKTTGKFTVERQYKESAGIAEVEERNQILEQREKAETEPETKPVAAVPAGTKCKIKKLVFPEDSELLKSDKQKKQFKEGLQYWLGYENVKTAAIKFQEYNKYENKTLKNELIFALKDTSPEKVKQISAVYDKKRKEWTFAIVQ